MRAEIAAQVRHELEMENSNILAALREKQQDAWGIERQQEIDDLHARHDGRNEALTRALGMFLESIMPNSNWTSLAHLFHAGLDVESLNREFIKFERKIERKTMPGASKVLRIRTAGPLGTFNETCSHLRLVEIQQ
jgi:hypothetical protein